MKSYSVVTAKRFDLGWICATILCIGASLGATQPVQPTPFVPPAPESNKAAVPAAAGAPAVRVPGGAAPGAHIPGAAVAAPQGMQPTSTALVGPPPKIVFEKMDIDLGKVSDSKPAPFKFPFKNDGQGDLQITKVHGDCGCTKAESTKNLLKSGETADIVGEFDTRGRPGQQSKRVTVTTNDPQNPTISLHFQATVEQRIEVSPSTQLSFGMLDMEASTSQTVKIINHTGVAFRVTSIKMDNEKFKAALVSPLPKGETTQPVLQSAPVSNESEPILILVTTNFAGQVGQFNSRLTIETDSPEKPNIILPIAATVRGDVVVNPPNAWFGRIEPDQRTSRTLSLESRSNAPFKIKNIDLAGLPVTVETKPMEQKSGYRLILTMVGSKEQKRIQGKITVTLDHPKQPSIDFTVMADPRSYSSSFSPRNLTTPPMRPNLMTPPPGLQKPPYGRNIIQSDSSKPLAPPQPGQKLPVIPTPGGKVQ